MNKDESKLLNVLKVLAGITIIVVIVLFIIAYQIGVEGLKDKTNRSTIISGLLSMIGGIAGAFGAYFIARMQMTKQLELQYKKEEDKLIKEVKINNYLKLSETTDTLLQQYNKLEFFLLEILIGALLDDEKTGEREKEIRGQIQTIKEQSTKVMIYKVFFDNRVLENFPELSPSVNQMENQIYRMLLDCQKVKLDTKVQGDYEKFQSLATDINKNVKKLIDDQKTDVIKILSYTNLYLKKAIE